MSDISKINMDRIEGLLLKFEEISNKLNSMKYVVETGQSEDGLQWYRKWSDGWIEQGGIITSGTDATVTVQLIVPMTTTNYHVLFSESDPTSNSNNSRNATLNRGSRTTTSFKCYHNRHTTWYVYGY